jgi:hypothetical protein
VEKVRKMGFSSKNDVEIFRPRDWATRAEVAENAQLVSILKVNDL